MPPRLCLAPRRPPAFRACAVAGLAALAMAAGAWAQSLSAAGDARSVIARLVAWGASGTQPVALADLTDFDWDHFSVRQVPAGDGVANCGRAGLMPCSPELQPPRTQRIQMLVFLRDGQPVYRERIMTELGAFAEPLPDNVPRAQAVLVPCPGMHGRKLWCLRSAGRARQPDPYLDGA